MSKYVMVDELLSCVVCNYFLGKKKSHIRQWKTKKFQLEARGGRAIAPAGSGGSRGTPASRTWSLPSGSCSTRSRPGTGDGEASRERTTVPTRARPSCGCRRRPLAAGAEGVEAKSGSRAWSWAALMHRAFAIHLASRAASVRVWEVMSRHEAPRTGEPVPEGR